MEKEVYVIPRILLLSISTPINILDTLSAEGNVVGYEGGEEEDF